MNPVQILMMKSSCIVMPDGCAVSTTEHPRWNESATHYGTNNFRFNAFPAGFRTYGGEFYFIGNYGYWWSSTENEAERLAPGMNYDTVT